MAALSGVCQAHLPSRDWGGIHPKARERAGRRRTISARAGREEGWTDAVCLAIPGQVTEILDEENHLARVEVAGVRRIVNVGLLQGDEGGVSAGDWVLIHVGFAISLVDELEAHATRRLLEQMGAEYEQELAELKASAIE